MKVVYVAWKLGTVENGARPNLFISAKKVKVEKNVLGSSIGYGNKDHNLEKLS